MVMVKLIILMYCMAALMHCVSVPEMVWMGFPFRGVMDNVY